jgi:hypothetical protein
MWSNCKNTKEENQGKKIYKIMAVPVLLYDSET